MDNRTLHTMILNAGLEIGLNPDKATSRYDLLVNEIIQYLGCSKLEAVKLILSTNKGGEGANVSNH